MHPSTNPRLWLPIALLVAGVSACLAASSKQEALTARILRQPTPPTWRILEATELDTGTTVPATTHVVFTVPADSQRITRRTLFGRRGDDIRYWGYCFPEQYDPKAAVAAGTLPGKLFLSEAEREWRAEQKRKSAPVYSVYNPPTRAALERQKSSIQDRIRHEKEVFSPGETCYVMTSAPLPIGTDRDLDSVNARVEKEYKTDPANPDTDGDGIGDGHEIYTLKTSPIFRDSDGDGLIDGIEDANRNGKFDAGETSPLNTDSDSDGLCDGFCRMNRGTTLCSNYNTPNGCQFYEDGRYAGEDKNLNGNVDAGETNPLKWSTYDDGISDLQHYYSCLLQGKYDC